MKQAPNYRRDPSWARKVINSNHAAYTSSPSESRARSKPQEACASRRVCGARGSARARSLLTEGVPEAWREVSGRGAPRGGRRWAGGGEARPGERQRCAASGSQLPLSRPPCPSRRGRGLRWLAGGRGGRKYFVFYANEGVGLVRIYVEAGAAALHSPTWPLEVLPSPPDLRLRATSRPRARPRGWGRPPPRSRGSRLSRSPFAGRAGRPAAPPAWGLRS